MKPKGYAVSVEAFPKNAEHEVERIARGDVDTFVRLKDGSVYVLGRRYGVSLAMGDGSRDSDRSAFARLSGYPVKEYLAALRRHAKEQAKRDKARDLAALERQAKRAGYRLVKVKVPTP
jgi:hypothetical protein